MALVLIASVFMLSTFLWSLPILVFAFRRSVGTGVMVLLIPFYVLYFSFSQFEHPRKALVVGAWLGSAGMAALWMGLWRTALMGSAA